MATQANCIVRGCSDEPDYTIAMAALADPTAVVTGMVCGRHAPVAAVGFTRDDSLLDTAQARRLVMNPAVVDAVRATHRGRRFLSGDDTRIE